MTFPPQGAGRATRAVLEEYERSLATSRRWARGMRVTTVVLVVLTVLTFAASVLGATGLIGGLPGYLGGFPLVLLIVWLFRREDLTERFGRPGVRPYPHQLLEIAAATDEAELHPKPFGAIPPSMRVYHPDAR